MPPYTRRTRQSTPPAHSAVVKTIAKSAPVEDATVQVPVVETTVQATPVVDATVQATPVVDATAQVPPVVEATIQAPPSHLEADVRSLDIWDKFRSLISASLFVMHEKASKEAMLLIATTNKCQIDANNRIVIGDLVIVRDGAKITAHQRNEPSFVLSLEDFTQPVLWVQMLQRSFAARIRPTPLPSNSPALQTPSNATNPMQLVMALLARLPIFTRLVISSQQSGEISLNIIGRTFNAIVIIVGEQVYEVRRYAQFSVPWRDAPQANPALGAQIMMITADATKIHAEIVPTPSKGYIGAHYCEGGDFVCLSRTDAMVKYRLVKPRLILFDHINPSLVVIKKPHLSFHGVIESIEKKSRTSLFLSGKEYSWDQVENLDTVFSDFANHGKL